LAALTLLLKSLVRIVRRELRSFLSVGLNNFFLLAALMAYSAIVSGMAPWDSLPFFLLLAVLMLFPMSSDPLAKIPPSRLELWPFSARQRIALRVISFAASPILWIALALLVLSRRFALALLFLAVALPIQIVAALATRALKSRPAMHPLRHLPRISGRTGGLIRHNLRQLTSVLDFYAALIVAVSAAAYRWFDPKALSIGFAPLGILIALVLSTPTQSAFGLESDSGLTRYALFPLKGWRVLLAKDAAFFIVTGVLILPLWDLHAVGAAATFTFTALTLGRYPSLVLQPPQLPWRFSSGDFRFGAAQMVLGSTISFLQFRNAPWLLLIAFVAYAISLAVGARYWDFLHGIKTKSKPKT
jgi:hypothetical protein